MPPGAWLILVFGAVVDGPPAPAEEASRSPDAMTTFHRALAEAGLRDRAEATVAELEAELRRAQDRYVLGDLHESTSVAFEITRSPRFAGLRAFPAMTSAHYHLALSLAAEGAHEAALEALRLILAKGPSESLFSPALRRFIDLSLAQRNYDGARAELKALLGPADPSVGVEPALPETDIGELRYLELRAHEARGDLEGALAVVPKVPPKSRFYTASLYLAGLLEVRRQAFARASQHFCRAAGGEQNSTDVYFVDHRFFEVRDLAQLGLARLAHEERRHVAAFFHYLQLPEDSERVVSALYESARAMAEQGEYAIARDLAEEALARFEHAPQADEARVLLALLRLHDCGFADAERDFTRIIDHLVPRIARVDVLLRDPEALESFHAVATRVWTEPSTKQSGIDASIARALSPTTPYARLLRQRHALEARALPQTANLDRRLSDLRATLDQTPVFVSTTGADAASTLTDTARLRRAATSLRDHLTLLSERGASSPEFDSVRAEVIAVHRRAEHLELDAQRRAAARHVATGPSDPNAVKRLLRENQAEGRALADRSMKAARALGAAASQAARGPLERVRSDWFELLAEARMGRIDAVLGAKKRREIVLRRLARGHGRPTDASPPQAESSAAADLWPYEGEYWADEYEAEP